MGAQFTYNLCEEEEEEEEKKEKQEQEKGKGEKEERKKEIDYSFIVKKLQKVENLKLN